MESIGPLLTLSRVMQNLHQHWVSCSGLSDGFHRITDSGLDALPMDSIGKRLTLAVLA